MNATLQRVADLKSAGEDYEWYPTTDEIIQIVAEDMASPKQFCRKTGEPLEPDHEDYSYYRYSDYSRRGNGILDIGAGDGRVLLALREAADGYCKLYAIEKATVHLQNMPKEITVLGTDFVEQSLVDKDVSIIFCNPPYSEYEEWTCKIIREADAKFVYLVIPKRWSESVEIAAAIKVRGAEIHSLGEFDFLEAERQARAKVEVLRVEYSYQSKSGFDAAIEQLLPELEFFDAKLEEADDSIDVCALIRGGGNMIETLVNAYNSEMESMLESYRQIVKINPKLLKEVGVDKSAIVGGVAAKIEGLKNKYWKALFDEFTPITSRLATKQRKAFLDSLTGKHQIDFTEGNIYSMLIWVTKHANDYFDEQLIDLFRNLSESCNITKYKSNDKTWGKGNWRYCSSWSDKDDRTHYKLEYRLVVSHGGISTSRWDFESRNGLAERAFEFLQDCVTVANNLGFTCTADGPGSHRWSSGKSNDILLDDDEILVNVRAFQNQNMHMKFNQRVILAINVEAGRLLGWLKSPQEAVDELQVTGEDAEFVHQTFGASFRIEANNTLRLSVKNCPQQPNVGEASSLPPVPTLPPLPPVPM